MHDMVQSLAMPAKYFVESRLFGKIAIVNMFEFSVSFHKTSTTSSFWAGRRRRNEDREKPREEWLGQQDIVHL